MAKKRTTGKGFAEIRRKKRDVRKYKMKEVRAGTIPTARITGSKAQKSRTMPGIKAGKKPSKEKLPTKKKLRTIQLISRKGQPRPFYTIERLERKSYLKSVSSIWLSTIGFLYNGGDIGTGTFTTKTGRQYKIYNFPFEVFEEWYYAHSKGTYFNEYIRDQYENDIKGTL